jgi:hypothetical protein
MPQRVPRRAAVSSCGGGGGTTSMSPPTKSLTVSIYDTGDFSKPVAALDDGSQIRVSHFTTSGSRLPKFAQSAYVDGARNTDVRVIYDAGVPVTLFNAKTKEHVMIKYGDNRVDFLMLDGRGRYVKGTALDH